MGNGAVAGSDWQAQWIDSPESQGKLPAIAPASTRAATEPSHENEQPDFPPNVPPYLRKTFDIGKPIARARLYATALGLYRCSINGMPVGDIIFAPDWTNYHHRVRYQTYDVTRMLRDGANAIGAILGDGWYSGNVGWVGRHVYGERPALRAQLVIEYADGTRQVVATDASWRTALGPILCSDFQDGEDYDARMEMPGWNEPGFDDSRWHTASVRQEQTALEAQIAPPVRETQELAVKAVTEPVKGHLIFDFGQNMVGFVRLKVTGQRGTKLAMRFAEMLNPDGTIYTKNLRTVKATDTYVPKGDGQETWEPRFTFHGFRYVEVTGYSGRLSGDALTGIVIGSDNPQPGSWECSNPLLNQLLQQHRLGPARQFPLHPHRLSAARRAAGLDGRRPGLHPHRRLQLRRSRVLQQLAGRSRRCAGGGWRRITDVVARA